MHPGSKLKFPAKGLLPEALIEEPLVLNGNNDDTGNCLNEVEVLYKRTHSFSLLVDLTNQDISRGFVVVKNGDYKVNGPEALLWNLGLYLPEMEQVIFNVDRLFQ